MGPETRGTIRVYVHMYMYMNTHIYIYVYMYLHVSHIYVYMRILYRSGTQGPFSGYFLKLP